MTDLVGTHPAAEGHAAVAAAHTVADLLRIDAGEVDAHGVTRARVELVAGAGLLGLASPGDLGGGGAPPAVVREVAEVLAGACGSTWFVTAQHRSVAEAAAATYTPGLRSRWAAALARGDALGAVSFAHLRRPGAPTVRATRTAAGWRFDGALDWVTSWGLADVLLLMGETADREVVQVLLPMERDAGLVREGVRVTGPVPLAAMGGTRTVAVVLDGLHVPDDEVAHVLPKDEWLGEDAARTANAPPHSFGLTRAVVAALDRSARSGDDDALTGIAHRLADEVRTVRSAAYALVDDVPPRERIEDRLEIRAHAHELALRAASVLLVSTGGRGMTLTNDAQRWAREASFHLVQAQTPASRAALFTVLP